MRKLEQRYTPAQVAELLGVHRRTILREVARGTFPRTSQPYPNKILIPAGDVEAWLEAHQITRGKAA